MTYLRYSRALLVVLMLGLVAVTPIPAEAQSQSSVDKAKEAEDRTFTALREADADLAESLEEMERIEGEIYNLNWRIEKLGVAVAEYGNDVASLQDRARLLVLEAYTSGGQTLVATAFSASNDPGVDHVQGALRRGNHARSQSA